MSSSDQTFYNIKRLHVIFAVAAMALLAATVWMLAVDHGRQWKQYQRTYRDRIEPWLTEAAILAERTEAFAEKEAQLRAALEEARKAVPEAALIDAFCQKVEGADLENLRSAYQSLVEEPGAEARDNLMGELSRFIAEAKRRSDDVDRQLRFRKADFNEARSGYESGVGEGLRGERLGKLADRVRGVRQEVDSIGTESQKRAAHHEELTALFAEVTSRGDAAQEALANHCSTLDRAERVLAEQRPNAAKRFLGLPGIDALGSPLSVDQIWLPELTIDYNFLHVARFDRCTTCHVGIDKTRPGSPSEPALPAEETLTLELATPAEAPTVAEIASAPDGEKPESRISRLEEIYGFALARRGILDDRAPTVGRVLPRTRAANAGLLTGDVIRRVGEVPNTDPISDPMDAVRRLTEEVDWGQPLELLVHRGLSEPYSSHPRLDLYVGSLSPHPMSQFGCTICHQGQGSGTEFLKSVHTPNDPVEQAGWRDEHGWRRSHFWDFPMRPMRFIQSGCLQCHHEVIDLQQSDRFEDAPAPKLLAGYRLVRDYGCFGCHEINGADASGKRIGPDLRLEPTYHEAALELLAHADLTEQERALAGRVVDQPEDAGRRRKLVATVSDRLRPESNRVAGILARDVLRPGTMRKAGPSLRDTAGKLDAAFLWSWLKEPAGLSPQTRMPRFFGLFDHLEGEELDDARRLEAVEIHAVAEYLLSVSQPVEPLQPPGEVAEPPSAARGGELFVRRGCVACHRHEKVREAESVFGPDLSNLGSKLSSEASHRWLTSWIREPARHSPRTRMPNTLLEPIRLEDDESQPARMTDPAADIAAFLLESSDREPEPVPPLVESDLDRLALKHLGKSFSQKVARRYLTEGIPESQAEEAEGDAVELLEPMTPEKKVRYVGRRTIRKLGCFGCHDIPGFEDAQAIAPALTDWGRKQESLLGFEQVHRFVLEEEPFAADESDQSFYVDALLGKRREGFAWQKLRAPRSFDYKKTRNKPYNERLAMGRFSFSDAQREAIITFVLGLTGQSPNEKYVYQPEERGAAIIEGRKVIDQYGCAECHTLRMDEWTFRYDPEWFEDFVGGPASAETFDFVKPHFSPEELNASLVTDARGWEQVKVVGMPYVDPSGEPIEDEDDDGNPILIFNLWESAAIHGEVWRAGGMQVPIQEPNITRKRAPWGGAFARLLYPRLAEEAGASWVEAWGWVPPPLANEGKLVRPDWLYNYLLDPVPVRPSVVLRMPKYNLSPKEASTLANYFAAVSETDFPYTPHLGMPSGQTIDRARRKRLENALELVTDRTTFCAKCHLIGDFDPGGQSETILAPRLDRVGRRIRPEYLHRWLADPKSVLPYTGMPVNFPPTGDPFGQDLYQGTSLEQIDAVIDLLLNYDWFMNQRTSIRALIESGDQRDGSPVETTAP